MNKDTARSFIKKIVDANGAQEKHNALESATVGLLREKEGLPLTDGEKVTIIRLIASASNDELSYATKMSLITKVQSL